jgi:hypothetical protein
VTLATKLEIFNRALGWLGQPSINSPDNPESPAGKSLANIYDQVRRSVLATYLWNFAEVTADTQRLGNSQTVYDDDYLYPQNCLKLLKIITDEGDRLEDYRLGLNVPNDVRVISIDNDGKDTLKLIYNYDVSNMFHWSPLACEVFALKLAIGGANEILGKENKMIATLNEILSEELKDAIGVDGQEQPLKIEEVYQTERARMGMDTGDDMQILNVNFP